MRAEKIGRSGFTLIELLVVIAIIAVLAAILFPVFAQAREKARQSGCLSNCKQIGSAVLMYAQDYDEQPPQWWYSAPKLQYVYWNYPLKPYVKNDQVFICPSAGPCSTAVAPASSLPADRQAQLAGCISGTKGLGARAVFDPDAVPPTPPGYGSGSYGWNACFVSSHRLNPGKGVFEDKVGTPLSQIPFPSETIMIGETSKLISVAGLYLPPTATYAIGAGRTACGYPDQKTLTQWWVSAGIRHSGGMNIIFFDGHAKWTKEETLLLHPEWFIAGNHNIPAADLAAFNAVGR